jgi:exodeoxyribonuclease VII small subunit
MKKQDKEPGYAAAFEELEKILSDMESGEVDVDDLSAKVKRAAELIEFCRRRLKDTEVEVRKVVEKFEKETGDEEEQ